MVPSPFACSTKTFRPRLIRRTCFVILLVILIAPHILGLPLKFSFGFSLRQLGPFIVIFIVSHISGLPLKFSLPGSLHAILAHGFCVEFPLASAGNIILIGWLRYFADLAALAGGTVAETVPPPAGGEGQVIRLCSFQVSAQMTTGQGRVGLFLLFSFHLEVLDRILVLRGLGPAGQQLAGLGWPES